MSMRKINTKQLTAIKPIIKRGKKKYYLRYYCPNLQKDNVREFANTEAEARVLRQQINAGRGFNSISKIFSYCQIVTAI